MREKKQGDGRDSYRFINRDIPKRATFCKHCELAITHQAQGWRDMTGRFSCTESTTHEPEKEATR